MSSSSIIAVNNVFKSYVVHNNAMRRLLSQFGIPDDSAQVYNALQDVNFEVLQGESIGIVGLNGSGKSTLLQIICGTITPSQGAVKVRGKISALLELGAGFNPEFSGRENIYVSAQLYGLGKSEIDNKISEIIDFAGLGEFIDRPVKTYSSGMYARLGFSVAINVNADILIVDEALSVGDMLFQEKCYKKIDELMQNGATILFVTHDIGVVKRITKKCLWLNAGKSMAFGNTDMVLDQYEDYVNRKSFEQQNQIENPMSFKTDYIWGSRKRRMGIGRVTIAEVSFNGAVASHENVISTTTNCPLTVRVVHDGVDRSVDEIVVSVVFFNKEGVYCCGMSTLYDKVYVHRDGVIELHIEKFPLLTGAYEVSVSIWDKFNRVPYDVHERMYPVSVNGHAVGMEGIAYVEHTWRVL